MRGGLVKGRCEESEENDVNSERHASFLCFFSLLLLGVQLFPESNTQFLTETIKVLEVLFILLLVLNLGLDTYSRREFLVDTRGTIWNVMKTHLQRCEQR